MKALSSLFLVSTLFIFSCSIEQEKINYGRDSCHFCKMTIVDRQHASQAVSSKGKAFKYDAIECMINDFKQKTDVKFSLLLVNDYSAPGKLVDAKTAAFLISKEIKSPMGAFLSAFEKQEEAEKTLNEYGGAIYNWDEIQQEIN